MNVTPPPRIRPGWVWGIFIFYLVSITWSVLAQVLAHLGLVPVSAAQQEYMGSLRTVDYVTGFAIAAVQMVGATLLWLLRRQAFPVFMVGFVLGAASMAQHLTQPRFLNVFTSLGIAGMVGAGLAFAGGLVISAAILAYTWNLRRRGVLQ